MKKLLAIIVLGFLLVGCASLDRPVTSGMSKYNYCAAKNLGSVYAICNGRYYYYQNGIEVLKKENRYAVFKNVSEPTTSTRWLNKFGNGTFVAEVYGWSEAEKIIFKLDPSKKNLSNDASKKSSNNESTNKLNRTFTCRFANNPNEKSTIKIRGGSASETTAVGVLINYSKVSNSSKGAFTLERSSKPGRAWFIGAKSFLLLDIEMYPYNCN